MPAKKAPKLVCHFPLRPATLIAPAVTCNGFPARRVGLGIALCNVHERQVQVQGLPATRVERVTQAAASSFASSFNAGQFFGGLFGALAGAGAPATPPPAASGGMSPTIARLVMRFDAGEVLTVEMVQARRRELARKYHPDRQGGATAEMQELNAAAELLLEGLPR